MSAIKRVFRKVRLQLIAWLYLFQIANVMLWYFFCLLVLSGNIPKPDFSQNFSICHWNVNRMSPHNYSKVSLSTASFWNLSKAFQTLMMGFCQYQGTSCIALIILLMLNEAEFVSITRLCCLKKVLSTHFFQEFLNFKVSIGNKLCRFIHFIEVLVSLRMNFMTLPQTWNWWMAPLIAILF